MANFREHSKENWISSGRTEDINCGSLQRIADATEKMASNYTALQSDRDMYKRWYEDGQRRLNELYRQIGAFKGVITKLKKKAS